MFEKGYDIEIELGMASRVDSVFQRFLKMKHYRTMKIKIILILLIPIMTLSCKQKSSQSENLSKKEINRWIREGKWKHGWDVSLDESTDEKEFAQKYFQKA